MKKKESRISAAPASAASLRQDGRRPCGKLSKRPDKLGVARLRRRDTAVCADARALILWRLGHQRFLPLPETRKSKERTARSPRFGAWRLRPILGSKAMGGEVFRFGAPSPKNSSNRSPKRPNNPTSPTSPASPILPTRPTDQANPTDPTSPTGLNTAGQTGSAPATPDGALRPGTTHQKAGVGRGTGLGRTRPSALTAGRA